MWRSKGALFAVAAFALLSISVAAIGAADASAIESSYTRLDLDACENVTPAEMAEHGAIFQCVGLNGTAVRVAEGDLRMYVSYGPDAESQKAAGQTISAFNNIGETLEWRLDEGEPFATILRYRWDFDGAKGSTLVVTKLGGKDACHVAYVKAERNRDANALARKIADRDARSFSCTNDKPKTYGPRGIEGD